MTSNLHCPKCNQPLPGDAREGLCPACLVAAALEDSVAGSRTSADETIAHNTSDSAEQINWPAIPRYRILRRIGMGGMGEVYAAEQQQPRRIVALKVIRAGLSTHRNLQRFAYETEALARLHHPGIAQVYESGMAESGGGIVPFFAMELVRATGDQSAPTLTSYANEKKLGTRQRLELLAKVADAVHHAHQNGVIHRDLKPSNVLVDETGQPKVLDFGVARVTDADIQAVTMQTDIGQIIGTLPYMSPEQAGGDPSQIDTRTDVYGLGALAYELLTHRTPLDLSRTALPEAVRAIRDEEPRSLGSFERSLRGDVEKIVGKALAKEKQRRYASAAEFAADIGRYLNNEPVTARPPSARYQLAKFARRNKAMVGGVISTFVVLVAGIAVAIWFAAAARQSAKVSESRFTLSSQFAKKYAEFDDVLGDVAGAAYARRRLSELTIDYLIGLLKTNPDHADTLERLLTEYYSTGIAQESITGPREQIAGNALATYHKGLTVADGLAQRYPGDLRVQLFRARLISAIGRLERELKLTDESLDGQRVFDLAKSYDDQHPNDRLARRELAAALMEVAEIETERGKSGDATKNLERAEEIIRTLPKSPSPVTTEPVSKTPDFLADVKALPEAWRTLYTRGVSLQRTGRLADAVALYRQSLAQHENPDPADFEEIRDHWFIQVHIGDSLIYDGDLDGSLQQLQETLVWIRTIQPHSRMVMTDEALLWFLMGDVQRQRKAPNVSQYYEQARKMFSDLSQADPADEKVRRALTRVRGAVGSAWLKEGKFDIAFNEIQIALTQLGKDIVRNPSDVEAARDMLTLQADMGDLFSARVPWQDIAEVQKDPARFLGFVRRSNEWYQSAWKLAVDLPESENPLPTDIDSPITLSPRLTACKTGIKQLIGQLANSPKPAPDELRQFWCDYHLASDRIGPRRWLKINDKVWEEQRGKEAPAVYDIVGPNNDPDFPGILLRTRDTKDEALIPATVARGDEAFLKIRPAGTGKTNWHTVSLIYLEE